MSRRTWLPGAALCAAASVAVAAGVTEGGPLPEAAPETHAVAVPGLAERSAAAPWMDYLLQDADDKGGVGNIDFITCGAGSSAFCSVRADGSEKNCHGTGSGLDFFSLSALASSSAEPCSTTNFGGASGTTQCYSTSTGSGLTMSCSKEASTRPGFVCTSRGDENAQGTTFCGITTTGICSTWQTAAPPGPSGQQRCSTQGGNANIQCTAQSGATGWCSVDSTQESNVACTAFGGGQCSTIGGGSGNCSTLVNVGGVNQVNPPDASGKCTVP